VQRDKRGGGGGGVNLGRAAADEEGRIFEIDTPGRAPWGAKTKEIRRGSIQQPRHNNGGRAIVFQLSGKKKGGSA